MIKSSLKILIPTSAIGLVCAAGLICWSNQTRSIEHAEVYTFERPEVEQESKLPVVWVVDVPDVRGLTVPKAELEVEETKKEIVEVAEVEEITEPVVEVNPLECEKICTARELERDGVIDYHGTTYTWYSQRVLPGGGLKIPGRHVENRMVVDEDGYICLASGAIAKGTIVDTPLGCKGKVYDFCETEDVIDIYTDF